MTQPHGGVITLWVCAPGALPERASAVIGLLREIGGVDDHGKPPLTEHSVPRGCQEVVEAVGCMGAPGGKLTPGRDRGWGQGRDVQERSDRSGSRRGGGAEAGRGAVEMHTGRLGQRRRVKIPRLRAAQRTRTRRRRGVNRGSDCRDGVMASFWVLPQRGAADALQNLPIGILMAGGYICGGGARRRHTG